MIKDNHYFFEKVQSELHKNGLKFPNNFVSYYDKKAINRAVNVFEKPDDYEYQREFRFYIENDEIKPIKIQIGSLRVCLGMYKK